MSSLFRRLSSYQWLLLVLCLICLNYVLWDSLNRLCWRRRLSLKCSWPPRVLRWLRSDSPNYQIARLLRHFKHGWEVETISCQKSIFLRELSFMLRGTLRSFFWGTYYLDFSLSSDSVFLRNVHIQHGRDVIEHSRLVDLRSRGEVRDLCILRYIFKIQLKVVVILSLRTNSSYNLSRLMILNVNVN